MISVNQIVTVIDRRPNRLAAGHDPDLYAKLLDFKDQQGVRMTDVAMQEQDHEDFEALAAKEQ